MCTYVRWCACLSLTFSNSHWQTNLISILLRFVALMAQKPIFFYSLYIFHTPPRLSYHLSHLSFIHSFIQFATFVGVRLSSPNVKTFNKTLSFRLCLDYNEMLPYEIGVWRFELKRRTHVYVRVCVEWWISASQPASYSF